MAQLVKNPPAMQETLLLLGSRNSVPGSGKFAGEAIGYPLQYSWASLLVQLVKKIPWRRERLSTPVFWPGELHGLYSPWGRKELDPTERLSLSLSYLSIDLS